MRIHSVRSFIVYSLFTFWLVTAPLGVVAVSDDQAKSEKKAPPPYALIFGTVWDAQGRPAYGVPIKIRRADEKKPKWQLMSDHRGEFAQRLPAGKADYVVWADVNSKKGQKDGKPVESKVHIENDERVDIGLHLTE
jgi:hypothetical protein